MLAGARSCPPCQEVWASRGCPLSVPHSEASLLSLATLVVWAGRGLTSSGTQPLWTPVMLPTLRRLSIAVAPVSVTFENLVTQQSHFWPSGPLIAEEPRNKGMASPFLAQATNSSHPVGDLLLVF